MDFSGYGWLNNEERLSNSNYNLRPFSKMQWLFFEIVLYPFSEYYLDDEIDQGLWFEQRILFASLNKKQVAVVLNALGVTSHAVLFIHCLKKGLVSKEGLRPVLGMEWDLCPFLDMLWFHGVQIYFRVPNWRVFGRGAMPNKSPWYLVEHERFKCSMVVLNGLGLLPEHWREAAEFLGYL